MMIYRTAAACGLALEMFSHLSGHGPALPVPGDPLQQIGLVFGVAFIATEASEAVAKFIQCVRRQFRRHWKKASPKAST